MTVSLRTYALLLLVPIALCAVPPYDRYPVNNKNLDHIDTNDLTPPQDPATNDFPKEPVIPLLPTCVDAGYFRDPYNCGKFYYCHHVGATPATYYCQTPLIFNHLTNICDDPAVVDC